MLSQKTYDQIDDSSLKATEDDTFPGSPKSLELTKHKPQESHEYVVEINREETGVSRGTRPRQKQDHISWSAAWLQEVDRQGNRVADWVEQGPGRTYRCRWCDKTRKYGSRGKASLLDHSGTQGHKANAELGQKNCLEVSKLQLVS